MSPEVFAGLGRTVVHGGEVKEIAMPCPEFIVDRLEMSSLTMSAFELLSLKLGHVSLLEGDLPVMGETFSPGNIATFNRLRFHRQSFPGADVLRLTVRNCRDSSFEWSGTIYGHCNF